MTVRLLEGDCRETLATLEAESVQAVVTSPPYFSLRDYQTPPLVWGGAPDCAHIWGSVGTMRDVGRRDGARRKTGHGLFDPVGSDPHVSAAAGQFCECGAWRGSLGLEPDVWSYVEHLVECFRAVRRVLRPDGALWINLGLSYAGSGKGPSNGISNSRGNPSYQAAAARHTFGGRGSPGFKSKDLMLMPFYVAEALRQDGWYLRGILPWLKRNPMPQSVTDRPTTSVEYVLYLTKSARCYYDATAVRRTHTDVRVVNGQFKGTGGVNRPEWTPDTQGWRSGGKGVVMKDRNYNANGRAFRDSDLFFQSWQGLLLDDDDEPMALVVNPAGFTGKHYAVYPPKLLEPLIKASTRPGDTVLDPFSGAGTTLLVADRLGRHGIGCDLNAEYTQLSVDRLRNDAPLFLDLLA